MKTNYKVHLEGSGVIASCAFAAHAVMIRSQYARASIKWGGMTLLGVGERVLGNPVALMEERRLAKLDEQDRRRQASYDRYTAEMAARNPEALIER